MEKVDLGKALSRKEILSVSKPARYMGKEWNMISGREEAEISVVLAFPDLYEIGMSHLGLKILYHILNSLPGVRAERAFVPWPDGKDDERKKHSSLFFRE